jgi:hypothetical protein
MANSKDAKRQTTIKHVLLLILITVLCNLFCDFVYSSKNKCERYYKQFQLDISYDIQLYFTYFAPEALNKIPKG